MQTLQGRLFENICTYIGDIYRDFRSEEWRMLRIHVCYFWVGDPIFSLEWYCALGCSLWVHCWSLAYEEVCVFPCSWSVTLRTSLKTDVLGKFLLELWVWWLQWECGEFDCWVSLVLGIWCPLESCTWRVWAQPWEGLWRLCLALRVVIRCVCLLHLWLHCLLALC